MNITIKENESGKHSLSYSVGRIGGVESNIELNEMAIRIMHIFSMQKKHDFEKAIESQNGTELVA